MPIPIVGFSLANVCSEVERKDRPPLLLQLLFFLPADFCRCDAVLLHLTDKLICWQDSRLRSFLQTRGTAHRAPTERSVTRFHTT